VLVPNCDVENTELAVFNGNGESELENFGTCVDEITDRVNQVTIAFTWHCYFLGFKSLTPILECSLSKKLWRSNTFTLQKMELLKLTLLRVTRAGRRSLFLNQTTRRVTRPGKKNQRENMFPALTLCVNLQQCFVRQARKIYPLCLYDTILRL